jgi:hypothetical protein
MSKDVVYQHRPSNFPGERWRMCYGENCGCIGSPGWERREMPQPRKKKAKP